jgi:hypothetical protein
MKRQLLSRAEAEVIRDLKKCESALVAGYWHEVRDAAIRIAALAATRAAKKSEQ